jgi:hypothetical protein
MDVFKTMIVPASLTPLARALAVGLSEMGGQGMFTAALSPTGTPPSTHYVSTGYIDEAIANSLDSADTLYAACQAAGAAVTLAQCQALVSQSDVSEQEPFSAFARLGLQMVQEDP